MFNFDWQGMLDRAADVAWRFAPRLLAAIIILLLLRAIVRLSEKATGRLLGRAKMAPEAEQVLTRLVRIAVIVAGLVIVLLVMGWGQLAASFVAGLGISGLVIGFALQDITKNFAAGLLLLFVRPFRIGDRLAIGADEGTVTEMTLRETTLRTADGRELLVPNATVYTGTIANLTRYAQRRHAIELVLKPDVALGEAVGGLTAVLRSLGQIMEKPAAEILVTAVKIEGVTVEARFWLPSQGVDGAVVRSLAATRLRDTARERGWLA